MYAAFATKLARSVSNSFRRLMGWPAGAAVTSWRLRERCHVATATALTSDNYRLLTPHRFEGTAHSQEP